jgi:putative transposase
MSPPERRALVERDDPVVPIVAQCRLLKIARSTLYYRAAPVDPDDLAVMRRMDELYLASPFYGSRRMVAVLRREGVVINRKRVRRLMRVMGKAGQRFRRRSRWNGQTRAGSARAGNCERGRAGGEAGS